MLVHMYLSLVISLLGVRLLSNTTSVSESDEFVTLTLLSSFPPNESFTIQVFTMQRNRTTADSMSKI